MRNEREANSQLHRQVKLTEAELDRLNAKYRPVPRLARRSPWDTAILIAAIGLSITIMLSFFGTLFFVLWSLYHAPS